MVTEAQQNTRVDNGRIWAVSYLLLVVALVGLAAFTFKSQESTQTCIGLVIQSRSQSANSKDRAELALVEARRVILDRLSVLQVPTWEERHAYDVAERRYVKTLHRVLSVRKVTEPKRFCRDAGAGRV